MLTLEQLEVLAAEGMESLDSVLLPPATAIPDWPEVALTLAEADKMLHGQPISTGLNDCPSVQLWAVAPDHRQMIGIGQIAAGQIKAQRLLDRKSTRLNSSYVKISY